MLMIKLTPQIVATQFYMRQEKYKEQRKNAETALENENAETASEEKKVFDKILKKSIDKYNRF